MGDKNQISNIDALADLINLQELHADENKIQDISALERLTQMQVLDMSRNNIGNIDVLINLTKLKNWTYAIITSVIYRCWKTLRN